jgi:hypothetical protein
MRLETQTPRHVGFRAPARLLAFSTVAAVALHGAPAHAQTVAQLKKLLAEKEAEIARKDAVIRALEAKTKKTDRSANTKIEKTPARAEIQLGFNARPPLQAGFASREALAESQKQTLGEIEGNEDESARALERTLVREGASILAPYQAQITPTLVGAYWDPERPTIYRNSIGGSISAAVGLPWETQLQVSAPFTRLQTAAGHTQTLGDISLGLSKRLLNENETTPNLLLTAGALYRTGAQSITPGNPTIYGGTRPPSGYGGAFVQLSASKRFDPVTLFASVSSSKAASLQLVDGNKIEPGISVGGRLGALLALSPSMSLNGAFNFSRETDVLRYRNAWWVQSSTTIAGSFSLGLSAVLTPKLMLQVTGTTRIVGPTPNFTVSVALPYLF